MSNYKRYKDAGINRQIGAYFSSGQWHIMETILEDNHTILSHEVVAHVDVEKDAETLIKSRTGVDISLVKVVNPRQ